MPVNPLPFALYCPKMEEALTVLAIIATEDNVERKMLVTLAVNAGSNVGTRRFPTAIPLPEPIYSGINSVCQLNKSCEYLKTLGEGEESSPIARIVLVFESITIS